MLRTALAIVYTPDAIFRFEISMLLCVVLLDSFHKGIASWLWTMVQGISSFRYLREFVNLFINFKMLMHIIFIDQPVSENGRVVPVARCSLS